EEHGIRPDLIAGTSFGALIGALYSAGWSTQEIEDDALNTRSRDLLGRVLDFGLHKAALFEGNRLEAFFERMLDGRSFEDLQRKFVAVATDVDTGEAVMLQTGSLARALRASTALPGI